MHKWRNGGSILKSLFLFLDGNDIITFVGLFWGFRIGPRPLFSRRHVTELPTFYRLRHYADDDGVGGGESFKHVDSDDDRSGFCYTFSII